MASDIEICKEFPMKNIVDVAQSFSDKLSIENYGKYKAKVHEVTSLKKGNIILITAINPTKFGEGKTTVAIGLHDSMRKMGINSSLVLREPSMGPVFGIKGGATGGGYSQIVPMQDINLHFTGDLHAITSANNLISAVIDNSIYFGNPLKIKEIWFKRCLDVNDRSLREGFNITAASDVMAVFCLSKDYEDLRNRLEAIIIGINESNEFLYVKDLNIVGSLMALLKDAFKPNLVQTLYNNPVLVHGGPFANIAHGCASVTAIQTAMNVTDYVITEAGFGSDAGAFKFLDIVSRENDFAISSVVVVATIRALKYNGNGILQDGFCNLEGHINNLKKLNVNLIVTLNRFDDDSDEDVDLLNDFVKKIGYDLIITDSYSKGESGSLDLAKEVLKYKPKKITYLYDLSDSLENKIQLVAKEICHASNVKYSDKAKEKLKYFNNFNYPINFAKTQYSFSDDPKKLGNPLNTTITVTDIKINNGAKFIIVYLGNIIAMPGLSKIPNATKIDINGDEIVGLI